MKREMVESATGEIFEVASNGTDRCWVDDAVSNVARFQANGHAEVHKRLEDQMKDPSPCLDCRDKMSWEEWVASVEKHHRVEVPESHRPSSA